MAKNRGSRPVQGKKVVNPLYCGTITVADQRKAQRRADREDRIASGVNAMSGCGVWTDKKKEARRKACRGDRYDD
jgi:hypothetical protein